MMAKTYLDRFRDATVKTGSQRKIQLPCPKCSYGQLFETEIIRTAGAYTEHRFAGFDFYCPNCYYKWKETVEITRPDYLIKRPGLYVRSSIPDIAYTKNIATELISFFRTRLETHPHYQDNQEIEGDEL